MGYGGDLECARQWILEAIQSVPDVLSEPEPDVLVYDLAGSSVNIRARWWGKPPRRADELHTRDQVVSAIKNTLSDEWRERSRGVAPSRHAHSASRAFCSNP